MKTFFLGTVEGSLTGFNALVAAGLAPGLVLTLPPEKAERHSDFADLTGPALAAGCEVFHTADINGAETLDRIREFGPQLGLVIGWSQICRKAFLSIPDKGCIGFHPAALPRLRGRAVIPWTLLIGEREAGSSLFWLDEGCDSGDILLQRRFDVGPQDTARILYDRHTANLAEMLPEAVRLAEQENPPRIVQDESKATYCAKRTPEDGRIDWSRPAEEILLLIRAVGDPYPGAFTTAGGDVLVLDAAHPVTESWRYVGVPGQVQTKTDRGFIVACGDGQCIEVTAWRCGAGQGDGTSGQPRRHAVLGR